MSFTSFAFLVFVAIVVLAYYITPAKYRWIVLLLASYGYYLQASPKSFIFILTVGYIVNVVFTACVGNVINTFTKGERIPFGKILKISFYCNTFSAVFGAFTLSYGGLLISSFLGSIYMFFAVRNIKEATIQSL